MILDRSPGIAIPDESFFVPLLARRHRGPVDTGRFLDDLSRIPVLAAWGLAPDDVAPRLRPGIDGEAISAIYEAYAAKAGKPRWGDKTPMYMRHLPLLERLFPDAQYVHLVRDGRDAATSFLRMPEGTFTRTWAHPESAADFACLWRIEVEDARDARRAGRAGRYLEARYEELVAEPESTVRAICAFAELPFEPAMLEYAGAVDVSAKPHQQRLLQPPTTAVRDWRTELDAAGSPRVRGDRGQRCSPSSDTSSSIRRRAAGRPRSRSARLVSSSPRRVERSCRGRSAVAALAPAPPARLDDARASARRGRGKR